jgi:hypothetical protein
MPRKKTASGRYLSLPAFKTELRMLFVMADYDNPNAIRQNAIKKVIRESLQVRPAQVANERMKSQGIFCRCFDMFCQFVPELVPKATGYPIISAQNAVYLLLN